MSKGENACVNQRNRDFVQEPPCLTNTYEQDKVLQNILRQYLPSDVRNQIEGDLKQFGKQCATSIARDADLSEHYMPELVQIRAWGHRVDEIVLHEAWKRLHDVSAREGLIAIGYERKFQEFSRIYQYAKLYLFSSVTIFSCPLAMTDGAARLVEIHGDKDLKERAYKRLISRDPAVFCTSGQWMTEKTGGSDVSNTSTVAKPIKRENLSPDEDFAFIEKFQDENKFFTLSGYKFFTSAASSAMSFALGRIHKDGEELTLGNPGLSCFYIEVLNDKPKTEYYHLPSAPFEPTGKHSTIQVLKLKDKLGTKALPTAELILNGTPAYLVGEANRGISTISEMFNITRIHNAISSCSLLRRALILAKDFATKRTAFGRRLIELPLHVATLARVQAEYEACTHLSFYCVSLLGRYECQSESKFPSSLRGVYRLLLPLTKLYTAKAAVRGVSELLECHGGSGYMEDSGIPHLLRDAQVLPIWEGTTNVLSLDVLRVLLRQPSILSDFKKVIDEHCQNAPASLSAAVKRIQLVANRCEKFYKDSFANVTDPSASRAAIESVARDFSYSLATAFAAGLMVRHAVWCQSELSPSEADAASLLTSLYVQHHLYDVELALPNESQLKNNYQAIFVSRL